MGMSPIDIAREAIAEGLSMQSYSNRFFANDAKPGGGWIEVPGKMGDRDTKKTFRDDWQQMQGGANRGKVAVLERGMKFHELGLNNEQAQFVEARAAKKSEIAGIFRVPAAQDHGPEPVHEQQHRAAGHRVLAGLHAAVDGAVGVLDRVLPAGVRL
jgi:HK97 family phage portal protein